MNNRRRMNREITAPTLLLTGFGVMTIAEAMEIGYQTDLDVVEVDGTVDPPICELNNDYPPFRYAQDQIEVDRRKISLKKAQERYALTRRKSP